MPPPKSLTDITPGGYAKNDFYVGTTTTDEYVQIDFINCLGKIFIAGSQIIRNVTAASNALLFSYDGVTVHGQLDKGETVTFDHRTRQCLYIKSESTGMPADVRIWAW